MTTRRRVSSDLAACAAVLAEVHAAAAVGPDTTGSHRYPLIWPADPVGWLDPPGMLAAWVAVPVADASQSPGSLKIAGHVGLLADGGLSRLFVAPSARGRGLGAELLATASAGATELGLTPGLEVLGDGGPAIALYERLGWRLTGRGPAEWTTPEGFRPILRRYAAP